VKAWGKANVREHNARAWAVWHMAYLPNAKRPVKLQALLLGEDGRQRRAQPMSIAELDVTMRNWRAAMAPHFKP
jgi:hypothetical protein